MLVPETMDEPVTFAALDSLGLVAHPDVFNYSEDVLGANFPDDFSGAARLHVRTSVNQIGQILAPVAEGLGYTLLPRSDLSGFAGRNRLRVISLPHPRIRDLWAVTLRGRKPTQRLQRVLEGVRTLANDP